MNLLKLPFLLIGGLWRFAMRARIPLQFGPALW